MTALEMPFRAGQPVQVDGNGPGRVLSIARAAGATFRLRVMLDTGKEIVADASLCSALQRRPVLTVIEGGRA